MASYCFGLALVGSIGCRVWHREVDRLIEPLLGPGLEGKALEEQQECAAWMATQFARIAAPVAMAYHLSADDWVAVGVPSLLSLLLVFRSPSYTQWTRALDLLAYIPLLSIGLELYGTDKLLVLPPHTVSPVVPSIGVMSLAAILHTGLAKPAAVFLFCTTMLAASGQTHRFDLAVFAMAGVIAFGSLVAKRQRLADWKVDGMILVTGPLLAAGLFLHRLHHLHTALIPLVAGGLALVGSIGCRVWHREVDRLIEPLLGPELEGKALEEQQECAAWMATQFTRIVAPVAMAYHLSADDRMGGWAALLLGCFAMRFPLKFHQWEGVLDILTFLCAPAAAVATIFGVVPRSFHDGPILCVPTIGMLLYSRLARPLSAALLGVGMTLLLNVVIMQMHTQTDTPDSDPATMYESAPIAMVFVASGGVFLKRLWRGRAQEEKLATFKVHLVSLVIMSLLLGRHFLDLLFAHAAELQLVAGGLALVGCIGCRVWQQAADWLIEPLALRLEGKEREEQQNYDAENFLLVLRMVTPVAIFYHILDGDVLGAMVPFSMYFVVSFKLEFQHCALLEDFMTFGMGTVIMVLTTMGLVPTSFFLAPLITMPVTSVFLYSTLGKPLSLAFFIIMMCAFCAPLNLFLLSLLTQGLSIVVLIAKIAGLSALAGLREKERREASLMVEWIRGKLEGQQEAMALVAHRLYSPIAALEYKMRLLKRDQTFVAQYGKDAREIDGYVSMILSMLAELYSTNTLSEQISALVNQREPPESPQHRTASSTKHRNDPSIPSPGDAQSKREKNSPGQMSSSCDPVNPLHGKIVSNSTTVVPLFNSSVESCRDHEPRSKLAVMIVDDVKCLRVVHKQLLARILAELSPKVQVEVLEAATGEECIQKVLQTAPPDVILIDQYMQAAGGVLLGSETVQTLVQNGFSGLLIGCSGNAECASQFLAAGARYFWQKPGPPDDELLQLFKRELGLGGHKSTEAPCIIALDHQSQAVDKRGRQGELSSRQDLPVPEYDRGCRTNMF